MHFATNTFKALIALQFWYLNTFENIGTKKKKQKPLFEIRMHFHKY